ncbi:MAG: response regulator [Candidatus Methylomirabilales bacterium]
MLSPERTEVVARQKKRILLIDDDSDLTHLLKLNLEETGAYEVKEENRGEDALAAARAFWPDLILLDLMMPNVLGGKVATQLEADEELKETPIVFFTAVVTEESKKRGTIGGRPFIEKPASPEEVMEAIEQHLPKKILLICDEGDVSRLLRRNIEETPAFRTVVATGEEAALELIKTFRPDLILLDMMMPGMDGIETLRRIKGIAPDLPVAMVTAVRREEEATQCREAGASAYITKPVDVEELTAALVVQPF